MRLDMGIERVIIGTMAIQNPDFVKQAISALWLSHIAVGIDAKMVGCYPWLGNHQ